MNIESSRHIWQKAQQEIDITYTLMAFSGGNDSLSTYHVAKELGIPIDGILHCNTRTGIPEVADYCREFAEREGLPFIMADAGTAFEDYVLRKGFFGKGSTAHEYAYHVLKAGPIRKALSHHFRKGKRGVNIALLNGARREESERRTRTKPEPINKDPSGHNYWVSLIHDWSKVERDEYLESIPGLFRNPVATTLCRSGECFCGTMQAKGELEEAMFYYPEWGDCMKDLERRVFEEGFTWGWGDPVNDLKDQLEDGAQMMFPDFMPMCVSCKNWSTGEEL